MQWRKIFDLNSLKPISAVLDTLLHLLVLCKQILQQKGRQPEKITEKTKVTFSVNDWSNNQLLTKYDPIRPIKLNQLLVIQVGTKRYGSIA